MNLNDPSAVLSVKQDIRLDLNSASEGSVYSSGQWYVAGPYVLEVLSAFRVGCSLAAAVRRWNAIGLTTQAVKGCLHATLELAAAGVLVQERDGFTRRPFPIGGYSSPMIHIAMLNDIRRKSAFIAAITALVRPDDVVLDLGTGSGILAMAAARAGAKAVVAIEPSSSAQFARETVGHNGFSETVSVLDGWLEDVSPAESPFSLITTDIVGNEPLGMSIWETLHSAKARLGSNQTRLLPSAVTAKVHLVEVPIDQRRTYQPDKAHVESWIENYGFDFTPLMEEGTKSLVGLFSKPSELENWSEASHAVDLYSVNFHNQPQPFDATVTLVSTAPANALAMTFYADLGGDSQVFAADTRHSDADAHWFLGVWLLPETVETGTEVKLRYSYAGRGRSVFELVTDAGRSQGEM